MELRSELSQRTKTILTHGSEFSWLEQVGHEFKQQRARNFLSAVRRICVKIECD